MSHKVKIEGFGDLYKDKYSGAILNFNKNAYIAAKNKRETVGKIEKLEKEIESIKNTNEEIKILLKTLLERTNP
jgi:hypothetical protein